MPTGQKSFCSFTAESTLMEPQLFFFCHKKVRLVHVSEGDVETIRIFCTEFKPYGKWFGHFCSHSFPPKPLCINTSRRIFGRKVAHASVLLDGHQQGKDKTCESFSFPSLKPRRIRRMLKRPLTTTPVLTQSRS